MVTTQRLLPLHPERKLLTGCRHDTQGAVWLAVGRMATICYTCSDVVWNIWSQIDMLTEYDRGVAPSRTPASTIVV